MEGEDGNLCDLPRQQKEQNSFSFLLIERRLHNLSTLFKTTLTEELEITVLTEEHNLHSGLQSMI